MGFTDILELLEGASDPTGIDKVCIVLILFFMVIGGLWKYDQERRKIKIELSHTHCDRIKASVDRMEANKDRVSESLLAFLHSEERTKMVEEIAGVSLKPDEVDAFLELYASKRVSLKSVRDAWPHHKMIDGKLHFRLSSKSRIAHLTACSFCLLFTYLALHNLVAYIYITHKIGHGFVALLAVCAIVLVFVMSEAERSAKIVENAVYGKNADVGRSGKSVG